MYMNEPRLQFFRGYSLVDITATGVIHSSNQDDLRRNQQRNWETVLQCMGLRTQPLHIQEPILLTVVTYPPAKSDDVIDLNLLDFGELYKGEHKVWTWGWAIEAADVYNSPAKPMGALYSDFENIPVITNLTETARFMLPILHPYGSIKNIYFKQLESQ